MCACVRRTDDESVEKQCFPRFVKLFGETIDIQDLQAKAAAKEAANIETKKSEL